MQLARVTDELRKTRSGDFSLEGVAVVARQAQAFVARLGARVWTSCQTGLARLLRRELPGGAMGGTVAASRVNWAGQTTRAVRTLFLVSDAKGWTHLTDAHGVRVWRKYLTPKELGHEGSEAPESPVPVIKAYAVMDAPSEAVFDLLLDNSRVQE